MQTRIHPDLAALPKVQEAESILRSCVHCGFCTATCPTYQLLGDELDSPRGRIYLIKNLLEENAIDDRAVKHLDRCLTCRACETNCPSGVKYSRLLEIGKELIAKKSARPASKQIQSALLRLVVPRSYIFTPLLRTGQFLRPVLPGVLANKIPEKQKLLPVLTGKPELSQKNVLLLKGCVQRAATPNVNIALEQLLATQNFAVTSLQAEGCCGAVDYHLSAHDRGLQRMRDLIDKLHVQLGKVDYIVSSASGCGVTIKEYPLYLSEDPEYARKAAQVFEKVVDVSELLGQFDFKCSPIRAAVHTPCTLQHGQGINGEIENILQRAGITIVKSRESHLCCGSAGTYSIMQPDLSKRLKTRKLAVLQENSPQVIVTANIGCQLHLQTGANVPVIHWVELLQQQNADL
jgi:glycolate dehydrogenase iron-sulfur subunit